MYFLKITLNDKIITTFIKPEEEIETDLGSSIIDDSNIRMNINRKVYIIKIYQEENL